MKKLLLVFLLLAGMTATAQERHPIYLLELRLMEGDARALFDIAPYFDDTTEIVENLGYHILTPTVSSIARRIVKENTIFTQQEIVIDTTVSSKKLLAFLGQHKKNITFSDDAGAFLITPLKERKVRYEFRNVSNEKMADLKARLPELLDQQWVRFSMADSLLRQKDPKALLAITSELFKARDRYDRYNFNKNEFTDLLQCLTGIVIGVEDIQKQISWHVEEDFDPAPSFNLLVYFSKFYKDYKWDDKKSVFVNSKNKIPALPKENLLFEQMGSENDTLAMEAFIALTSCNPNKVRELSREYDSARLKANFVTPIFTYRFLEQLSILTQYCRNNNIDHLGSAQLRQDLELLKSDLSFKQRRQLENRLIETLTLNDITAFEYWSLVYEQSWNLTYSAGRILDIFYSKNWNKLLSDRKYLDLYLKKSALFDRLGIVGICNEYLLKFADAAPKTLSILKAYETKDPDIKEQASKAVALQDKKYEFYPITEMDTAFYHIDNFNIKLENILKNWKGKEEEQDTLVKLLSKISYQQIGEALVMLEKIEFNQSSGIYLFLDRDWGFFLLKDVEDKQVRQEFMKIYNTHDEKGLYTYYLDQGGIDYKNFDGSLDYDVIYDLMKYDIVNPLAGGGGGSMDNEVYSLIKLLELNFDTTLGFSNKQCSSQNIYGCYSDDRVRAWSEYLKTNNLLKLPHDEPISFHTYIH